MTPILFTKSQELQRWRSSLPNNSSLAFVPTMGALHAGHERLIQVARTYASVVVTSIFVNPKQFNNPADLAQYPRTLDTDIDICEQHHVDAIFAPTVDEIYPVEGIQAISAGRIGDLYEGEFRLGHFAGVLTVVDRLFALLLPDFAVFGEKDYQQLVVIRQMSSVRHPTTCIISVPTVRDPDGLAISSRNVRLTRDDRSVATKLFEALCFIQDRYQSGTITASQLEALGQEYLSQFKDISLDYLVCVDALTLLPIANIVERAVVLLAATVGEVRLIDNILLEPSDFAT